MKAPVGQIRSLLRCGLACLFAATGCSSSPAARTQAVAVDGSADDAAANHAVAATDDAAPDGTSTTPAIPAVCANGPALDSFASGLTKAGSTGALSFVVASASPMPPAKYSNSWTVRLLDAGGQPVQGATFAIKTWMPEMKHGSSIKPQATSNGDGTYTIATLYFQMAGIWQITLTAQSGTTNDSAVFTFCVPG